MRLKCIGCEVLARPIYLAAARSPHIVDVEILRRGLHDTPPQLRAQLQGAIDALGPHDAVVLAYGLCGAATAGLVARDRPVVIPRAHDCITLLLGSRDRYREQFEAHPGTFWYAQDYIERESDADPLIGLGSVDDPTVRASHEDLVAKYGQENADYLMEVMGAWKERYDRATFIDVGVSDSAAVESRARADAERRGWTFERLAGDTVLIRRLLFGDWADEFLVLQPGERLEQSYDEGVVCAFAGPRTG
jgi:hypothetical protein